MAKRVRVLLMGFALASCTAHADAEDVNVQTEAEPMLEPDRFAWLAEVEPPSLEHDPVLSFAATAIECSPARPWQPSSHLRPSSIPVLDRMKLLYGDEPEVAGFNAAVGLPLDAVPSLAFDYEILRNELSWSIDGELGGFERITWTSQPNSPTKPIRIDGFDAEGQWRRTALFQHEAKLTRRVEFVVVDGVPIRSRTLVFEREQELVVAKVGRDRVEYRRWRTDRGSQAVIFEHRPDRLVRTAEIYERGVPYERVDVLPALAEP